MNWDAAPQLLAQGVLIGSFYAMLALSWGIIFSTTGVFHFAHALTFTLAAYAAVIAASYGLPLILTFVVAATIAGFFGVATDFSIYRPLRRREALPLNIFLASLGLLIAGQAVVQFAFGPNARTLPGFRGGGVSLGPVNMSTVEIFIAVVSWFVIVTVVLFLRKTQYGFAIRAVSSNPELSQMIGINSQHMYYLVFFLGSTMSGIAAVLFTMRDAATPEMGVAPLLTAFVAVFIGGIGSLMGAVVAGLILGILENLSGIFLPGYLSVIVSFVVLFVILVVKPTGLFARERE